MLTKYNPKTDITQFGQLKTSEFRKVRQNLQANEAIDEETMEILLPRKKTIQLAKCRDHISLLIVDDVCHFLQTRDTPFVPSLRVLHRYPNILKHVQVDKGAIKFIIRGADVMCRGLTTPGAVLGDFEKNEVLAIHAEGKQHAIGIGRAIMSSEEIRSVNSGIGLELIHHLGDGLWKASSFDY
ncbi:putative Malignant T-cell-amplified sequence 1 [Blattamonas nauphoetae]|uniref:Malignant T-cell-amplified sequence 1 n=1 Tax=Blattamonas nauphoetae TaxID=2049346 RepID=A0ABQ9XMH8_9EUKA|nr:putative Malignant T-cell-amplified sequence 1 [Blattamonas nauphoetae]